MNRRHAGFLLAAVLLLSALLCQLEAQSFVAPVMKEGERLYKEKEYAKAEKKLRMVIRLDRRHARAHYFLARIYLEAEALRDTSLALSFYQKAKRYKLEYTEITPKIAILDAHGPQRRLSAAEAAALLENQGAGPDLEGMDTATASVQDTTAGVLVQVEEVGPEPEGVPDAAEAGPTTVAADPDSTLEAAEPVVEKAPAIIESARQGVVPAQPPSADQGRVASAQALRSEPLIVAPAETASTSYQQAMADVPEDDREVLEAVLVPPDTRLGGCLEAEEMGEKLDFGCKQTLQVFRAGTEMCLRKIERGLYEEADGFANDVKRVAPDFWQGYYLKALIFLDQDDPVTAEDWWKEVEARRFLQTFRWPNLRTQIVTDPKVRLQIFLADGRRHIQAGNWIEADDVLIKTQDIENLDYDDPEVAVMDAEVSFRLGEIALYLKDCETAVDYLQDGIDDGHRPSNAQILLDEARECAAESDHIVEIPPADIKDMEIAGIPRGFGSVRLHLGGKEYIEMHAETRLGGQRVEDTKQLDDHAYYVQGGRIYRIWFNIRRQLRRAFLHEASAAVLVGVIVLL
jgi:tetratricopeptide (TPR) repeat protein